MKLFIDEDLGRGIPDALWALRACEAVTFARRQFKAVLHAKGKIEDEDWIPFCGENHWLVISCNKAILETEAQLDLWNRHRVGGVFLSSGQFDSVREIQLILKNLQWLEAIDEHEPRAFAFHLPFSGKPRLDPRVQPHA